MNDSANADGTPKLSVIEGGACSVAPGGQDQGFKIRLRSRRQTSNDAIVLAAPTALEALHAALEHDVSGLDEPLLEWHGRDELLALDLDVPDDRPDLRLKDEDIPRLFPEWLPRPAAAWVTHGGGVRAAFVAVDGTPAPALAGLWHLLAPLGIAGIFGAEAKADSRHPLGKRGEEVCGRVFSFEPSAQIVLPRQRGQRDTADADVEAWLAEHGLTLGRHPAELCPWCGGATATCNPSVVVDDDGIRCYRCGRTARWGQLLDTRPGVSDIESAGRELVHLAHQRLVLRDARPTIPEDLLAPTWAHILRIQNKDRLTRDAKYWGPLIALAASDKLDIVRSASGVWLSATTLEPRQVHPSRTLKQLPWATSPARIDKALSNELLEGFVPVDPVPHSAVLASELPLAVGIRVRRPPRPGEAPAVDLGSGPPTEAAVTAAWGAIETMLPGLHRGYLQALVLADLVAQRAVSTPPILVVTGLPGSAKTATARLAAGMVGRVVGDVSLAETGDVLRQFGLHIEAGRSPLFVDEIGRARAVYEKLQAILQLNSSFTFRAKYRNECTVPCRAPIVLAGSTLPRAVVSSQELARRSVTFHLSAKAPRWSAVGDVRDLRQNPNIRPHLDVITSKIWWLVRTEGEKLDWRRVCIEEFGALALDELDFDGGSAEGRDHAVKQLYEAYRNASEDQLTQGEKWAGWLDCSPASPFGYLLGELVDFDADTSGHFAEIEELKRLDLTTVLGIGTLHLRMMVNKRGGKYLVKFAEHGVAKGKGIKRRDLPPAAVPRGVGSAPTASATDSEEIVL